MSGNVRMAAGNSVHRCGKGCKQCDVRGGRTAGGNDTGGTWNGGQRGGSRPPAPPLLPLACAGTSALHFYLLGLPAPAALRSHTAHSWGRHAPTTDFPYTTTGSEIPLTAFANAYVCVSSGGCFTRISACLKPVKVRIDSASLLLCHATVASKLQGTFPSCVCVWFLPVFIVLASGYFQVCFFHTVFEVFSSDSVRFSLPRPFPLRTESLRRRKPEGTEGT